MKTTRLTALVSPVLLAFAACSSSTSTLDGGEDTGGGNPMDATAPRDSGIRDAAASPDVQPAMDAAPLDALPVDAAQDTGIQDAASAPPDTGPSDSGLFPDAAPPPDSGIWGPAGSAHNPAPSCKAILTMIPTATSGPYFILPQAATATTHQTYCDMTTDTGGWTKIAGFSEAEVDAIKGSSGREMLKCADNGIEYIESPTATLAWSWGAVARFRQIPGMWKVNDQMQPCDSNPEYTQYHCTSWWGWGCGNGPGNQNKLFPGVLDQPSAGFCADTTSAHTNATFSICTNSNGPDNYRTYSVFMRGD